MTMNKALVLKVSSLILVTVGSWQLGVTMSEGNTIKLPLSAFIIIVGYIFNFSKPRK